MADSELHSVSPGLVKQLNKGKKRVVHINEWKDNVVKQKKNAGKEYVSRKGLLNRAKEDPSEHSVCKCKHNDCTELTFAVKKKLHKEFHSLGYDEQSQYLVSTMECCEPARRRQEEATSQRHCTFKYTIQVRKEKHRIAICQKALIDVFQISRKHIQVLQTKIKNEASDFKDKRGTHTNRPHAISHELKESIRLHIKSFPSQENHYSRGRNQKLCLSPALSLSKMFELFKENNPETTVNRRLYRDVFKAEFNLRFGAPRSDTCQKCDKLYVQLIAAQTEEEEKKISQETELHHRKAEKAYSSLRDDTLAAKENPGKVVVLCIDLQQVLFCPTLTHSNIFYQRQFSTYNFAVYDVGSTNASMHLWHESIAKRGSAEISSCIFKYICDNFVPLNPNEERKLVIWSDRCVGQNNNWKTVVLLQYLVALKYFTEVNHKFLASGHSFLPCDRDFALIERKKKVCKVNVPSEWKEVLLSARPKNPFVIVDIEREYVLNFTPLEEQLKKGNNLKITTVMWMQLRSDDPTVIKIRTGHNVLEPWTNHCLTKKKQGLGNQNKAYVLIQPTDLHPLYDGPLAIKKEKKADLLHMCAFLNEEYRQFYVDLPSAGPVPDVIWNRKKMNDVNQEPKEHSQLHTCI